MSYKPINIVVSQNSGIRSVRTDNKLIKVTINSSNSNDAAKLKDSALQSHNKFRSKHKNTPLMIWDEELARGAQQWADQVSKEDKLKHGAKGENIFKCSSSAPIDNGKACDKAVESWYSEINNYDYIGRKSVNGKPTGHFTQVVWSSSTKLGVGISQVHKNNMIQTYVVARYDPPGNLVGAHDKNVFLPKNVEGPVPTPGNNNNNAEQQQKTTDNGQVRQQQPSRSPSTPRGGRNKQESTLAAHNNKRSQHSNTPMLVWDEELARGAQEWAQKISKEGKMKHGSKGENIFMCGSSTNIDDGKVCEKAVESWYSEIQNYDFNTQQSKNEKPIGHFTQVVWASTSKVGVGIARTEADGVIKTFLVARYDPPGNLKGSFHQNVNVSKGSNGAQSSPRSKVAQPMQAQVRDTIQLTLPTGSQGQQQRTSDQQRSGQQPSTSNIKEASVAAHNQQRSLHRNTPMLSWDDELAKGAQKWAKKISKEGKMKHGSKGENIFMCCSSGNIDEKVACERAVKSWYSEIKDYDFSSHASTNGNPVGHFTQVVWSASTTVGVGIAKVNADGMIKTFVVARYGPPGNLQGAYQQNVNAKK